MYSGMIIKTFPETDVDAYVRFIRDNGYKAHVFDGYIRVGGVLDNRRADRIPLGRLIKRKRKEKGITRTELAQMLNYTTTAVYDWEIGRRCPKAETMEKLKEILNITEGDMEKCQERKL